MFLRERSLNFIEIIFLLCFLFIPLKFFTIKVASVSLTFSRLLLLILIPIFIFHLLKNIKLQKPIFISSNYFNKYALILLLYCIFSYFFSFLLYSGNNFSTRIHLSSLSFFESFFILPFLFFILVPSKEKQLKIFELVFKYLKFIILIAFIQFFLDLAGFPISYEALGEPAPENRADLAGFSILRLNSFFGEPRDLAICLIPIYLLNKISSNTRFRVTDLLIILTIGILTVSSSFIQSLIASAVIWSLFVSRRLRLISISLLAGFIVVYFLNFELIRDFFVLLSPRFEIIFQILSPEVISNIAQISPEFRDQISDISFIAYILNGEIFNITGLFGHGLGSAHFAIDKIAFNYFNIQHEGSFIYGSRWLFYTFFLEIGLTGMILFILFLKEIYLKANNKLKEKKLYIVIFFVTSLLGSAYIFILLSIYMSIEQNTKLEFSDD